MGETSTSLRCFRCVGLVQCAADCKSVCVVEVVLFLELDVILGMN